MSELDLDAIEETTARTLRNLREFGYGEEFCKGHVQTLALAAEVRRLWAEVVRARHPVSLAGPIPAPDYTMRTGWSHKPLPNRDTHAEATRMSDDDDDRATIEALRKLYREAIGTPPSEHQQRRLEEMAQRVEAAEAALDRVRHRHPRGDEEPGPLAPGLWCPGCGNERADRGFGGCPDRRALMDGPQ